MTAQCINALSDMEHQAVPANDRLGSGVPGAVLVTSVSILLVALAYSRSREGLSFAPTLYWAGQVLAFGYVAFRVLKSSTSACERQILVALYAVAQSAMRWAYSPHIFSFSDELFHLRTLLDILETGHLFKYNYSLPISPYYPGTENVTAELVQVSSLSPFVSGVLVASVSHVLLAGCTILLFREVSASSRIACMAALLYMLNPHAPYFATSYVYETVALPFMVLALYFSIRFAKCEKGGYPQFAAFAACFAIVVVTHHASVIFALELLAAMTVGIMFFRRGSRMALRSACSLVTGAVMFGCWIHFVAPETLDYFSGPGRQIVEGLTSLGSVSGKIALPSGATPLFDRIVSPTSVLVTLILLSIGIAISRGRPPWERCFAWLGLLSYGYVLAVRVLVPNGAELAGRTLTFAALLTAPPMAAVLVRLATTNYGRIRSAITNERLLAATAIATVLQMASIVTSVQPWWDRLPGAFRIDGFASGVDEARVSKAEWANEYLPRGSRVFGDKISLSLLSTFATLDPILDPESLYDSDYLTPEDAALIRAQSAKYLDVDMRMSEQTPISGSFFPIYEMTSGAATRLRMSQLVKFDNTPGLSRIYDSGSGRFYDLRGGGHGSPYNN